MTHARTVLVQEAQTMVAMLDEKIADMLANITLLRANITTCARGMSDALTHDAEKFYSARWDKLYACLLSTIDQCHRSMQERARWVECACRTIDDTHCLCCDAAIDANQHGVCMPCRLGVTL